MKTWEMVKELTENPEKKFTYIGDGEIGMVENIGGAILVTEINSNPINETLKLNSFTIGLDWREVKEPVSFMRAVGGNSMGGEKKQYRIEGCVILKINADCFHNELPNSSILEHLVIDTLNDFGKGEFKVVSSQTNDIYIKDMTR